MDWRGRGGVAGAGGPAPDWRGGRGLPVIGITADLAEVEGRGPRAQCAMAYCRAVAAAGGVPVILPPIEVAAGEHLKRCDGLVLTGGDDPRVEPFGDVTHAKASPLVHPERQAYEAALLRLLEGHTHLSGGGIPVLGVCLGMQMMALVAGGRLNQHMPDDVPTAAAHAGNAVHRVKPVVEGVLPEGEVTSCPHQAVRESGRLRVVATAEDGVIEAIDDPSRRFYLGVQWHPERTADPGLGAGLFARLVEAARGR